MNTYPHNTVTQCLWKQHWGSVTNNRKLLNEVKDKRHYRIHSHVGFAVRGLSSTRDWQQYDCDAWCSCCKESSATIRTTLSWHGSGIMVTLTQGCLSFSFLTCSLSTRHCSLSCSSIGPCTRSRYSTDIWFNIDPCVYGVTVLQIRLTFENLILAHITFFYYAF